MNADPPRILRLLVRRTADENALLHTAPATHALLPQIAGQAWSERRTFIRYGKPFCGGESSDRELGERNAKVSELFHEAAETHRLTFRITDGADDDWRPGIWSGSSGCPSCPAWRRYATRDRGRSGHGSGHHQAGTAVAMAGHATPGPLSHPRGSVRQR
jgi:hypothetical protein